MSDSIEIQVVVSPIFEENAYLLWKNGQNKAIVVDPGLDHESLLEICRDRGLEITHILNTHGHADHIAGNGPVKEAFPQAKLCIGVLDAPMLGDARLNLSQGFGFPLVSPPADLLLKEGDTLEAAGMTFAIFDVPGHSPGHVVFFLDGKRPILLGGDVLFRDGIGRTDFPGGSHELLISGIENKLFPLPEPTIVYPGHGPVTTLGREKRENPFLR